MSLNNRIDQLSQIRETTLEAAATNAETGITYHGAAAVYRLQERRSANSRGVKEQVHFDLGDPAEVEKLRVSVTRRGAASVPNRKRPEWESSSPSDKQPLPVGSADAQDATEKGPTTTEEPVSAPFPTRKVLYIIATQILSSAPGVMFAAVAPYMYAALIGNFQTAGTVSSIATGVSMVLQMLFTPIAAQVMDLYGRKKLAVFSAVKAVVAIVPLLVAGIVISTGSVPDGANATEAKLGGYLSDNSKRFVHFLFAAYWVLNLLSNATSTSQAVTAIGDVCPTQRARSAAIGMYAGCSYTLAAFAVIGAKVSVVACGSVALAIAAMATFWAWRFMPETSAPKITDQPRAMDTEEPRNDATIVEVSTELSSVRSRRLSFYPSQRRENSLTERLNPTDTAAPQLPNQSYVSTGNCNAEMPKVEYSPSRRITMFVNPFAGFSLIKKSHSSYVALWVLFSCLMAEISASDTLVYYLSITLNFGPSEVSYLQIEQALLSVLFCGLIGPALTKLLSCAHISMICSVSIVTALIVLALAKSPTYIYAIYAPCISLASMQMPSLAAIITKNATTPQDVSLAMSTVMASVAVLQAAGSFLAALVFRALPEDKLYVTFIISAMFTVPMFALSVYLGYVTKKEQAAEEGEGKVAAEERGVAPLSH